MARVPVFDSTQTLNPVRGATLNVSANAEAFGAGIGRGLTSVSQVLAKHQKEQKDKDDRARVLETMSNLGDYVRDEFLGGESGYYNRTGKAALGATSEATQRFSELAARAMDEMDNDEQRALLQPLLSSKRQTVLDNLARHESGERVKYHQAVTEATIKSAIDDAASNPHSPQVVADSIGAATLAIRTRFKDEAPEVIEQKVEAATSAVHEAVVASMVNSTPAAAAAYYEANKDAIDGTKRGAIEKTIQVGVTLEASQQNADAIIAKHGTDITSARAALAEARKISDPRVREKTVSLVKARFDEEVAIKAREDRERKIEAWQMVEAGDFRSIPPSILATLDGTTIASMEKRARQLRTGEEPITDERLVYTLERMATDPERQRQFAEMDLYQYRAEMDDSAWLRMSNLHRSVRSALNSAGAKDDKNPVWRGVNTRQSVISSRMAGMTETAKATFNARLSILSEARPELLESPVELNAALDMLLMEAQGSGFWGDKKVFELTPADRLDFDFDQVPDWARQRIIASMRKEGERISDEAIISYWEEHVRRETGLGPQPGARNPAADSTPDGEPR